MPSTPTPESVQALLERTFETGVLTAAINDAVLILEGANPPPSYTDARLEALTRYLAGHLLASSQKGATLTARSIDGVAYSWRSAALGEGLRGTALGQQVLLLDPDGILLDLGKSAAKVFAV